jgi:hypothetical protein
MSEDVKNLIADAKELIEESAEDRRRFNITLAHSYISGDGIHELFPVEDKKVPINPII